MSQPPPDASDEEDSSDELDTEELADDTDLPPTPVKPPPKNPQRRGTRPRKSRARGSEGTRTRPKRVEAAHDPLPPPPPPTQSTVSTQWALLIAQACTLASIGLMLRRRDPALQMRPAEAAAIAKPAARLFMRTSLARSMGPYIADTNDGIALLVAVMAYAGRVNNESTTGGLFPRPQPRQPRQTTGNPSENVTRGPWQTQAGNPASNGATPPSAPAQPAYAPPGTVIPTGSVIPRRDGMRGSDE